MFVLEEDGIKAECVVTEEGNGVLEIKNLATQPDSQRRGFARSLIHFLSETFAGEFTTLLVGTGDSPLTIPFYEKCGFVRSHIVKDFFTRNYDHPIIEDGVLLTDMVYLKKQL